MPGIRAWLHVSIAAEYVFIIEKPHVLKFIDMKTHWYQRCENAKSLSMTKSNLDPIPLTGLVQLIGFYQARTDPQD